MKDWKSVKLEVCRIGMCDFMDYIGSIIFGIFTLPSPKEFPWSKEFLWSKEVTIGNNKMRM